MNTHAGVALSPRKHMPGLDVVRGAAIVGVFLYHVMVAAPSQLAAIQGWPTVILSILWKGYLGVHLFFVLSGFLITGILLDTKFDKYYFKKFYLRRVVRIVPAYFLMIAVLWRSGFIDLSYVAVSILYLCNMPGLLHVSAQYGPFWSLSVEEQFYLAWPLLVRALPRVTLNGLAWTIVILTPVLRLGLSRYAPHQFSDIHYKTWDVGDFLAAGALLAIYVRSERPERQVRRTALLLTGAGLFLTVLGWNMDRSTDPLALAFALEPSVALFSGLLLLAFCHPAVAATVAGKILAFIGAISYGLYLVHQYVIDIVLAHVWYVPWCPLLDFTLRMATAAAAAIMIAFVSRYTYEAYFLRLRWADRGSRA